MQSNRHEQSHLGGLYQNWFLDYASYVILERAVPSLADGLKPVQRRILYAMKSMDDGRLHKVANIIGQTMQYHPHGDAAIGDALVHLGQKRLLLETQGNWGDTRTGDNAAAPRYIEARLSKFALEVAFNADTTQWRPSYDGRKQEPVTLPVKFPLLLAQGVEGIAVGLATKIMPHNFLELVDASIDILRGQTSDILPDFPGGGIADFSNYNEGRKGGKIRLRATIEVVDAKTLAIRDIPYGTITGSLMESIVKANDSGKIKIKRVIDNTAENVEIIVELPAGVSADFTVDALYAFTDCEVSISPNCCVIIDEKPQFLSVNEVLQLSTANTMQLLQSELEIRAHVLKERLQLLSLEKIFIENRVYTKIEECHTWESVITTILEALSPLCRSLPRAITAEDAEKLTEIKVKRISKYNASQAEGNILAIEKELAQVDDNLQHLTDYAIRYFKSLKKKYGTGRERVTQIQEFIPIQVAKVAVANQKLYVNRKDGFVGYGLKKEEFISECSDLDDIIVFLKSGVFKVIRVSDKAFVGKDIIHVAVWKKNDTRMVYNLIYHDADSGKSMAKRFSVTAITRDKEYDLTKGAKGSKVLYFTANANGETEIVSLYLSSRCRARNKVVEFDFADLAIKGRSAQGNTVTPYPVRRIVQKSSGTSTFGAMEIWYDRESGRLNINNQGHLLGKFHNEDLILALYHSGCYQLTSCELTNKYPAADIAIIEKYRPETVVTAVHYDGIKQHHFVKRFQIETQTIGRPFNFITDHKDSRLILVSTATTPHIALAYEKKRPQREIRDIVDLSQFVDVKGRKAVGKRLCFYKVLAITGVDAPAQQIQPATPSIEETEKQLSLFDIFE